MQISTTVQHQAEMKLGTRLSSFMRQENSFINWYKSAGVLTQMLQSDWLSFSKSMSYYRVSRARRLTMCMSLSCQNSNTSRSFSLDFYVKYISNKRPSHHPFSRNFKKVLGHLFEELRFLILTLKLKQTNLLTQVTSLILIATHSEVVKSH